jgi:hypothetical protein
VEGDLAHHGVQPVLDPPGQKTTLLAPGRRRQQTVEGQTLGDGSVMRLLIVIAAVGIDSDKPVMHLTHFVSVTTPSHRDAVPPTMSCSAVTPCAFLTVDDVIEAFDVATVAVNARMGALIDAAEVSRAI